MKQTDWFDRKFDFSSQENTMPSLLERLGGAPLRLREKLKNTPPFLYLRKPDGKWSILEHAGHLSDLEPLWQGRLADILNGKKELRPTDLSNQQTTDAGHNNTAVEDLLERFDRLRTTTLSRLQSLSNEDVFRSALHPRLKIPMRTIDLFTFVAEHDDHHLAKITSLATSKLET